MSNGHCVVRRLGSMLVITPVVYVPLGSGTVLSVDYASSDRRGSLLVGSPWMGPDGATTQLLISLVTVALGSGSRLVRLQKAF